MLKLVAPFVGVWIEIHEAYHNSTNYTRRSLRGSVDWNVYYWKKGVLRKESLPSWECGLKFKQSNCNGIKRASLPSWECGLKSWK